ncbi:hypothetical protein DL89DRAFT_266175, partial [Linderina pennispora]
NKDERKDRTATRDLQRQVQNVLCKSAVVLRITNAAKKQYTDYINEIGHYKTQSGKL